MAELYRSSINGIELDIEQISDSFSKAIAEYSPPGKNGSELDDMGENARRITLACHFFNERYSVHEELLALLRTDTLLELVHPQYGLLLGRVPEWTVSHVDHDNHCQIDITFIEQLIGEEVAYKQNVLQESESLFVESQEVVANSFAERVKSALGADAIKAMTATIAKTTSIVSQIGSTVNRTTRGYLAQVDAALSALDGLLSIIENPASSIITTVNYANNIPGRVVESITSCVERYAEALGTVASSPAQFAASMQSAKVEIKESAAVFDNEIDQVIASYTALRTAQLFDADDQKSAEVDTVANSFDAAGNYIAQPEPVQLMTSNELEYAAYNARKLIDEAYQGDRSQTTLKDMALALQRHVQSVKSDRETIKTVIVTKPTPLHIICMKYGLHHSYAERIMRINTIENPSAVEGEIRIYA